MAYVGTPSEWNVVAAEIAAATSPWSSRAVVRLFALAEEDGRVALRTFRSEMGDDGVRDLIRNVVTAKLTAIVAADEPRGFFWKILTRAAISQKRRPGSLVVETPEHEPAPANVHETEEARLTRLDREARWARLSPKEQELLGAIAEDEDRDALARHWNTSRNNIDQLVSRARKRLTKDGK